MCAFMRILLADHQPALLVGLRTLLEQEPDIVVVAEANTGPEALAQIEVLEPDLVVLDCELPELSGPQVAAEIRRRGLLVRVLALSAYADDHYVRDMQAAGALGFLLKDEPPAAIVAGVRRAMAGKVTYSAQIVGKLANWERGEYPAGLTEREMAVLQCLVEGLGNKEIGRRLGITTRTVEFHVGNVMRKLDVASRVEAAVWATTQGITAPGRKT